MNSRRDVTLTGAPPGATLGALKRRAALLAPFALPLALGGCDWLSNLFEDKKTPLAGKRESVFSNGGGLNIDGNPPRVPLPPPVRNAAWPQVGGNPAHLMGHLAAAVDLREAWSADIGTGGGYRQVLMASPVVLNDIVFTMDFRRRRVRVHGCRWPAPVAVRHQARRRRQHQCRRRPRC